MKHRIKIAPSLLSADFGRLADEVKQCEEGGADILHVDVMDGHFVPNITVGPLIVEAIRKYSNLEIDCHLMINNPDRYIQQFVESGANYISVHVEEQVHIHRVIELIHKFDIKAGVALNPGTPIDFAKSIAEFTDFILLMSVNPGFGGQQFIPSFVNRAESLRKFLIKKSLKHVEIEVDGGVKIENVAAIVRAGANMLVCGSGLFKGNLIDNIKSLRGAAEEAN